MALFSWLRKSPLARAPAPAPAPATPTPTQRAATLKADGNALLNRGDLETAAARYGEAVALVPDDASARINLGYALAELRRPAQAEPQLREALRLDPLSVDAAYVLAGVLREQGDTAQAIALMRRALELKPDFEPCRLDLVRALLDAGEAEAGAQVAAEGLQLDPRSAPLHQFLGNVHAAAGRWPEATACYREALAIRPGQPPLLENLAEALKAQGDLPAAAEALRQVVAANPASAVARLKLGVALHQQGQADAAEALFQHAIALDPQLAEAHSSLGGVLVERGQLRAAIESGRRAVALDPDLAAAHFNLGNALQRSGRLAEAVVCHRRTLELQPDAGGHNNLAGTLVFQGRIDEAIREFRSALALSPGHAAAASNLLFALNYHPDLSAEEIFAAYLDYERRLTEMLPLPGAPYRNDRSADRRLKVGYVSADFRQHPVRHFLEPLVEHHDRGAFEIYAYSQGLDEDVVTARYRRHIDHWVPTRRLSDEALAQRIRDDAIDVLVDLAGHTGENRLAMFVLKPAPVSVSWLGYGYTTGLSAIDWFLTDGINAPEGCEALFAETPWRLENPCYAYRPREDMGDAGPLPALARGHLTFGTLTRAVRVNHRTIRVWSAILQRVPRSRLVVDSQNYEESGMQADLAAAFAAHGISRDRLQIGFSTPPWDVLRGIDIGLDCFPHNSGTTLFESLYMGLPYVTLAGRPSVGRLGSSILHGVGHPEWIAQSEAEYIEKAVALASDIPRLAQLRAGLRAEMQASALMDEAGFARKVEAAYREMFAIWARRNGP